MSLKDYPTYIKVPVKIDDNAPQKPKCRFYLKAKVNNSSKSKSVLVIMMNPSKATTKKTDNTVFNIIEHSYKFLDAKEITFLNLYPFYEPNSSNVKQSISNLSTNKYNKLMNKNFSSIKDTILKQQYDKVFLAWGNPPNSFSNVEHKKLGYDILSLIKKKTNLSKNLFVYSFKNHKGLTVKNNPFHPSRKGKIIGIQKIKSFSFSKSHPNYSITLTQEYIPNKKVKESFKLRTPKSY